jgi:hypothetical protein
LQANGRTEAGWRQAEIGPELPAAKKARKSTFQRKSDLYGSEQVRLAWVGNDETSFW